MKSRIEDSPPTVRFYKILWWFNLSLVGVLLVKTALTALIVPWAYALMGISLMGQTYCLSFHMERAEEEKEETERTEQIKAFYPRRYQ